MEICVRCFQTSIISSFLDVTEALSSFVLELISLMQNRYFVRTSIYASGSAIICTQ